MVIDSSALIAIFRKEPERQEFLEKMAQARRLLMSAACVVEISAVLLRSGSLDAERELDAYLRRANITVVAVDEGMAKLAREGYRRYGRAVHKAGLNFGDCFSYALAIGTGDRLLFKGDDFSRTDVKRA